MLLKLIPQRFTAVNQAPTCPYDVWIYYSKCCGGLGGPALILAPGDQLCFQSKEHLENGPGRLHAGVPLDTSYCPDLRKHLQMDLSVRTIWMKLLSPVELCVSKVSDDKPYKSVMHFHSIGFIVHGVFIYVYFVKILYQLVNMTKSGCQHEAKGPNIILMEIILHL